MGRHVRVPMCNAIILMNENPAPLRNTYERNPCVTPEHLLNTPLRQAGKVMSGTPAPRWKTNFGTPVQRMKTYE